MDLLLVNPYTLSSDRNERRFRKPFPPLGILYIASFLRERGYEVGFRDCTFKEAGYDPLAPLNGIGGGKADWMGFYTTSVARPNALRLVGEAKRRGSKVMVGGPDASMDPEPYLKAGADLAIVGEGEETVREVLEQGGEDLEKIPGIAYLQDGSLKRTDPRPLMDDLNSLPFPARDLAPIGDYLKMWKKHHGMSQINIISSRGCPFGCKWCCRPVYGRSFRQRSVDSVVSEMMEVKKDFDPDRFWFSDDVLPMKEEWVLEFSEAMANLGVEFECLSRVDLVNERIASALKRAGCRKVHLGVESGSQKVLDAMGKGTRIDQIRTASRSLKKAEIEQHWFMMYGYPGEGTGEIIQTMSLAQELLPESYGISIAYPLKGTEFYDSVKDRITGEDWTGTLENTLVFEREYSQHYYDVARYWTHGIVRSARVMRKTPVSKAWDRLTLGSAKLALKLFGGK